MNVRSVANTSLRWLLAIAAVTAVVVGVWWFSAGQVGAQENAEDGSGSDAAVMDAEVMTAALSISTHASAMFMDNSMETDFRWVPDSAGQAVADFSGRLSWSDIWLRCAERAMTTGLIASRPW